MARSHPMRNIWSVVITEHDPARSTTDTSSYRVDLRTAGQLAPLLRRTLLLAISILAQTCQELPAIEHKARASLDDDIDGYPSGASHLGRTSDTTDSTSDAALQRLDDYRAELVWAVEHQLQQAVDAACAVRTALERLTRS